MVVSHRHHQQGLPTFLEAKLQYTSKGLVKLRLSVEHNNTRGIDKSKATMTETILGIYSKIVQSQIGYGRKTMHRGFRAMTMQILECSSYSFKEQQACPRLADSYSHHYHKILKLTSPYHPYKKINNALLSYFFSLHTNIFTTHKQI